jgi:glucose/arabinose dehydrogenase
MRARSPARRFLEQQPGRYHVDHTSRTWHLIAAVILATVVVGIATWASVLRPEFVESQFAAGLSSPTAMAFAPDGRLFVCQQGGQLRVIVEGVLLPTPFTTVTVNASGERGLLGVAFDPDFATAATKYVYVYYTATTPVIHNRVSRFTANGNVAVPGSEVVLLELNSLSSATNHNGGAMHFGPDGALYIAVGDNANGENAQTLTNLLGKMLRINRDGSIPGDNPFVAQTTGVNGAIWAIGLRNPFTFSFDDATGQLFINDVGQNTWEEINEGQAGANYGWPATEGPTSNPAYTSPLYAYQHTAGNVQGCAITGGAFYSGAPQTFPDEYAGDYFFADYCGDWINQLNGTSNVVAPTFATGVVSSPVDLKVGPDGALYYLSRGSGVTTGVVQRIAFAAPEAPSITTPPQDQTTAIGQPATFSVVASGSMPLTYQWQRNGSDIAGATGSTYTLSSATAADNGSQFRCVVSNAVGSVTSSAAVLTVTGNAAPTPVIVQPAAGGRYTAGTLLAFSGTATDPEDGTLSASRFTWRIDFHHDTHEHPAMPLSSGITSGTYDIPNSGETSANVFLRVYLTAVDSSGQAVTVVRDVLPRTAQVTVTSNPSGFGLLLDGSPITAPHTFIGVAGILRTIGAPSPQSRQSGSYVFRSWSDQGAQTHTIVTPSATTTFSATYRKGGKR